MNANEFNLVGWLARQLVDWLISSASKSNSNFVGIKNNYNHAHQQAASERRATPYLLLQILTMTSKKQRANRGERCDPLDE